MRERDLIRFHRFVVRDANTSCWWWTGCARPSKGGALYGRFTIMLAGRSRNTLVTAHRWIYEQAIGPIPEGLTIDHLCGQTLCVNPAHLEAVTLRENILRGNNMAARHARQTHCKNGHSYENNTHFYPDGRRECRYCYRLRFREGSRLRRNTPPERYRRLRD